ncbi:hypothetical protein [Glaciihabitans sp. UYNi722]|uniref:hypothetical protein n=1 Tax=Glaciihabitans sp. UYNi722 TaxID=3156344 RepID=UPI0033999D7C
MPLGGPWRIPVAKTYTDKAAEGVPKTVLARTVGISRETVYAYLRADQASGLPSDVDIAAESNLVAVLSALPADERPMPSGAKYDALLTSRRSSNRFTK